jgi:sugar phosphate permease
VSAARPVPLPLWLRRRLRVRWNIFALMFAFGSLAYLQQKSLTVAALRMMPDLGLTQMQIGWLDTAFLVGYASMQFPSGLLGQRFRPRLVFSVLGFGACAACLVMPLASLVLTGAALFSALLLGRLMLGIFQAPLFPVSNGIWEAWFRPESWPLVLGVSTMCVGVGLAITPPLVAELMVTLDWRRALLWTNVPMLVLTLLWVWYGRNTPTEHRGVSAAELAEIGTHASSVQHTFSWQRAWELLKNRDVLMLTFSYICANYVFYLIADWCFLYLVQERHFTALQSGWLATTPALVGAAGAGVGGQLASVLGARLGVRRGLRLLPLLCLPATGVLLLATVAAENAYLAVATLAVAFACQQVNEGPYWASVMHCARDDTMSAGGLLNTGGNIGGLIAAPVTAYFSGHGAWTPPFLIGAALACVAAASWLWVDPTRSAARAAAVPALAVS